MRQRGRPRLTREAIEARTAEYCSRYAVEPQADGLPPFPAGQRETQQHREWLSLYQARQRLARREQGQKERCRAPVEGEDLSCQQCQGREETLSVPALINGQQGRCAICGGTFVSAEGAVVHERPGSVEARTVSKPTNRGGAFDAIAVHARCGRLVRLADEAGAESLERVRRHLWPPQQG